jgi:RNA polymerase sigma-70 factor (ECF subfamily)
MTEPARVIELRSRTADDASLVERALAGDAWAHEALYRRHVDRALTIGVRLLRNRAEAEDAVQDAFVHAFERLRDLRVPAAFRGWLARLVVTQAHRRMRRRFFRAVRPVDGFESECAPGASPEVRAEMALLDRALDRLAARPRIAWTLRHVEGLTLPEVADACGCSLATAKRDLDSAERFLSDRVRWGVLDGA